MKRFLKIIGMTVVFASAIYAGVTATPSTANACVKCINHTCVDAQGDGYQSCVRFIWDPPFPYCSGVAGTCIGAPGP